MLAVWFRAESAKTYREVRESAALVIVQFVETMTGIRRCRPTDANRATRRSSIGRRPLPRCQRRTFRLAIFMPGVKLVGNVTTGVVLLYGGYRAAR